MSAWTPEELDGIGRATELEVASRRRDGSLRQYVTIWAVRAGDDLYVRSAHGPNNGWYRRAKAAGQGRVRASGIERDVSFEDPGPAVAGAVTAAYHSKYDRYGPAIVGTVVSPEAEQLTPADRSELIRNSMWTGSRSGPAVPVVPPPQPSRELSEAVRRTRVLEHEQ